MGTLLIGHLLFGNGLHHEQHASDLRVFQPCFVMSVPCQPCTDDPILNISAEDADSDRFVFNIDVLNDPKLNETFSQLGCFGWCYSEISQEDAELCAILQQVECNNSNVRTPTDGPGGFPIPGGASPPLFFNQVQSCEVQCADGNSFGWTVPAGFVVSRSQLQANRIAQSFACKLARLNRICISTSSLSGCKGTAFTERLTASGGTPFRITFDNQFLFPCSEMTLGSTFPYLWQIVSGSLPAGLSLGLCDGKITGTPTASGTSMFTVRATDALGSYMQKQITMVVEEITTDILDDATEGEPYSFQVLAAPSDAPNEIWSIVDGTLPDGLSLDSAGLISGIPTETGDFDFRVNVSATVNGIVVNCEKDLTLSVELNECIEAGCPAEDIPTLTCWNIISGKVDLIGEGCAIILTDVLPGNGMYLDMNGTTSPSSGLIESKDSFTFNAGKNYKLSLKVAGSQRSPPGPATDQMSVIITTIGFLAPVTIAFNQGFTWFDRSFVGIDTVGTVRLRSDNPSIPLQAGPILKEAILLNETDNITMWRTVF